MRRKSKKRSPGKRIASKSNMLMFKKMASPALKDKMLEGVEAGMKDYYVEEMANGNKPDAMGLFERAKSDKDMNYIYQKAAISDDEIMDIAIAIAGA